MTSHVSRNILFVLLSSFYLCVFVDSNRRVTHSIQWNPRFTQELDFGNVLDIDVRIDEYMDIFCPQYDADEPDKLKFVIYNVSHKIFNSCILPKVPKKIFSCDSPTVTKQLTTKFQRRSPNPLGFTFRPGLTYYYMALPLDRPASEKGPCSNVMRLSINVQPKLHHDHTKYSRPEKSTTSTKKITTTTIKIATKIETTTTSPTTISKRVTTKSTLSYRTGRAGPQQQRGSASKVHYAFCIVIVSLIFSLISVR